MIVYSGARSRQRKCEAGHLGRIGKRTRICAGCLQDALEAAGWEYRDDRSALKAVQEARRRRDSVSEGDTLDLEAEALREAYSAKAANPSKSMREILG